MCKIPDGQRAEDFQSNGARTVRVLVGNPICSRRPAWIPNDMSILNSPSIVQRMIAGLHPSEMEYLRNTMFHLRKEFFRGESRDENFVYYKKRLRDFLIRKFPKRAIEINDFIDDKLIAHLTNQKMEEVMHGAKKEQGPAGKERAAGEED